MRDIFITQQPELLQSWQQAFPKAELASLDLSTYKNKALPVVFWLHMNQDRQQWLTNTIESIFGYFTQAKIVVLANAPVQAEAVYVLKLGAVGYCHAFVPAPVLKEVKKVITHGGLWLGQDVLQRLIEVSTSLAGTTSDSAEALLNKLTKREKEVAVEVAKGLSNKEIARVLNITERTVKAHLAAVFERSGAKDRLQLALMLSVNYKPVALPDKKVLVKNR